MILAMETGMKQQRFTPIKTLLHELEGADYYWKIGFYGLVIGAGVHFCFIFLFAYLHIWQLSLFNFMSVALYWYAIFGLVLGSFHNEKEKDAKIGWIVFVELLSHNLLASYILGKESGFVYYIYVLIGLPFFADAYSRKIFFMQKVIAISAVFFIEFCPCFLSNKTEIPDDFIVLMHYGNLFLFLAIASMLTYVYADHSQTYQKELREESNKDVLTGLYNRRHILRNQFALSASPFAVAILDIDHFKHINDNYGHHCGDKAIYQVATVINDAIAEETVACRWGGEEFLLLFGASDKSKIEYCLEKIRRYIEEEMVECEDSTITVTLTAGVAYDPSYQSTFETLLLHADKALYEGKANGRNQICVIQMQG